MSVEQKRDILGKTSLNIDGIRNSIGRFGETLKGLRKTSDDLVKSTKERNLFKKNIIGRDNTFFRKRRENVRRKQREDELEAQNIRGTTKRQGNLFQKSTRGFLGRILDFLGILLIGWAVNNLPKIIEAISGLIKKIKKVVAVLTGFFNFAKDFVLGIKESIEKTLNVFKRFNFRKNQREVNESFDKLGNNFIALNKDFFSAIRDFGRDSEFKKVPELNKEIDAALKDSSNSEDSITDDNDDKTLKSDDVMGETEKVEVEGRASGGRMPESPFLVGENRDGTINDTTEMIVPDQSGEVVNSENTQDLLNTLLGDDGVEPTKSQKGSGLVAASGGIDLPDLETPDSGQNNLLSVNRDSTVENIRPVQKTFTTPLSTGKKRKRSTIVILEKPSMQQPVLQSTTNGISLRRGGESTKTILYKLQSVSSLKYT